jgi:glycine hydroxymethyltransferase
MRGMADSVGVRPWLSSAAQARERDIVQTVATASLADIESTLHRLIGRNREIHEHDCVNLNPATNVMNPRAEAAMVSGLGTRPSLGHPGEKYEMGLEAMEQIEVICADLACRVFDARFAEIRVGSGALANLYAFMATCKPGDTIIVPPASIGGHVTHHRDGAAGLYGLNIHEAPVDVARSTIDVDALRVMAKQIRPRLITVGGSLNLNPHPVAEIRAIADEVGAVVLFDAAHACGLFAGHQWANPLTDGAHLMSMSTYKSLGGPPGGLLLTNDAVLAERIDAIAYPGLTANFDSGKTAALAITLLDWLELGDDYAATMIATAQRLATELDALGVPVHHTAHGPTQSYQFAIDAERFGGGHALALRLRQANVLASAIGLAGRADAPGLRLGTPEAVRWGMSPNDMVELATLMARAMHDDPTIVAADVTRFRQQFRQLAFLRA